MLTFLRVATIVAQALFAILAIYLETSTESQDVKDTGNAAKPGIRSLKQKSAVWGIVILLVIALATERVEQEARRADSIHAKTLERLVRALDYPLRNINVSADISVPANLPDIKAFLSKEDPGLDSGGLDERLPSKFTPYPEGDHFYGHPTKKIPYDIHTVGVPEELSQINLTIEIFKDYKNRTVNEDQPALTSPDLRISVYSNVWEKGTLLYDTVYQRVIKRVNEISADVSEKTGEIHGLSDLPGSTLVIDFSLDGITAPQSTRNENIDCIRISIPDGPTVEIDGADIHRPAELKGQSTLKDPNYNLGFKYEFPADLQKIIGQRCYSRGYHFLNSPLSYVGNP